jgi:hypothetical protein
VFKVDSRMKSRRSVVTYSSISLFSSQKGTIRRFPRLACGRLNHDGMIRCVPDDERVQKQASGVTCLFVLLRMGVGGCYDGRPSDDELSCAWNHIPGLNNDDGE